MKIKAEVIIDHPLLKDILEKGDIVEIETVLLAKDTILSHKSTRKEVSPGYFSTVLTDEPDIIAPAGSYHHYRFISRNGGVYDDAWLCGVIGYKKINEIFKIID